MHNNREKKRILQPYIPGGNLPMQDVNIFSFYCNLRCYHPGQFQVISDYISQFSSFIASNIMVKKVIKAVQNFSIPKKL